MNAADAKKAIARRFIERWPVESAAELGSAVDYSTDNNRKPEGAGFFARLAIISLDEEQVTIGNRGRRRFDNEGLIEVRLSCPVNTGTEELDLLAGAVRRIFRSRRIGKRPGEKGISTHASSVAELRRDREAPGRWLITVSTPFEYTDLG